MQNSRENSTNHSENSAKNLNKNSPQNLLNLHENSAENSHENSSLNSNADKFVIPTLPQNFLKSQNKKLKLALFKAYFILFKEFKRLYFGSNFKLKFYEIYDKIAQISSLKIIIKNSAKKLEKWRLKHKERKENFIKARANLKLARKSLKFLKEIAPQSEIWLKSPEFKAKYLDTKHPFPPLLNPANIDYEGVSANLAWELNLPLPPNYDLILISGSNMGHNAILNFFEHCGAKRGADHLPQNLDIIYASFYDFLVKTENKDFFKLIPFVQYGYFNDYTKDEYKRYCSFFTKKVPVLVQTRDPFFRLMTMVNDIYGRPNLSDYFSLKDDMSVFLDRRMSGVDYLCGGNFEKCLERATSFCTVRQASAIRALSCITRLDFIDTDNELMPNNAFKTMQNLAKRYGLKAPQDRAFFEGIIEQDLFQMIPLTLKLTKDDILWYQSTHLKSKISAQNLQDSFPNNTHFEILITLYQFMNYAFERQDEFIDISEIWGGAWIYKDSDVRLYVHKFDAPRLNLELKEILSHFFAYFKDEFSKRIELDNANKLSVEDVFKYFKSHKRFALNFKANLDKELEIIKELRPDIVNAWKFYAEFEERFKNGYFD